MYEKVQLYKPLDSSQIYFFCVELVKTGNYRVFDDIGKKCRKWLIGSRQKKVL